MTNPTPPPAPLTNVNLRIDLGPQTSISIISKTEHSFSVNCENQATTEQQVFCPIIDSSHRDLFSVINVTYAYQSLQLAGITTAINFDTTGNYTITRADLGLPTQVNTTNPNLPGNTTLNANATQELERETQNRKTAADKDPEVFLDAHARWNFNENLLTTTSLTSAKIPNKDNIVMNLADGSCLRMDITDMVYKLALRYNATVIVTAPNENNLVDLARNITANFTTISNENNIVSYPSTIEIIANMIISRVTNAAPIDCAVQTSPAPTPPPQLTTGLTRYGVITNPTTGQNSLGIYYGFDSSKVNSVFNYDHIDKYATLVKKDNCFKIKIWVVIPAFFIPIIFPLWIDASIVTSILGAFQSILTAATGTFTQLRDKVNDLKSQVSVKNAVSLGARAVAAGKAATTEEGLSAIANAAQSFAEKQLDKIKAIEDYANIASSVLETKKIIDKLEQVIETISGIQTLLEGLSSEGLTSRTLLETIKSTAENAVRVFKEFSELVDKAPDSAVKRKAQEIIREVTELFELVTKLAQEKAPTVDKDNPLEISKAVVEVLLNIDVIKKFISIAKKLDAVQLAYEILQDELTNSETVKLATELDTLGAKQDKSALEQQLEVVAGAAASEIDNVAGAVADVLQLNQVENLANAGLDLAVAGVNAAANALGSAAEGIENAKRNQIKSVIANYLISSLDLYKITIIANFDENNPTERQILVNDLSGTRIYSADGNTLLFERKDFCKHPFVDLGNTRLNSNGCQADTDPCGVGGFNCQEKNYWNSAFQYRISFDFYGNHDLSKGGVVAGDFDGNGVTDIMCRYPGTTRNYDQITKDYVQRTSDDKSDIVENHEIIYSPLISRTSNGRFESREQVLLLDTGSGDPQAQKHWCKDGVVKVGDFNGDKKDDILCITSSNNYLIYSQGYTFRPAGNNSDGSISIGITSSSNSLNTAVVVVGDFDGDKHSDLLAITKTGTTTNTEIYYGHKEDIFVQNSTKTNEWVNNPQLSSQLVTCYNVGVNRIIVDDINNDGKNDIACVAANGNSVERIYSTLAGQTNPTTPPPAPKSHVVIYVNNVQLRPYATTQGDSAKQSIRVDYQTHKNIYPADAILIAHNKMLPQHKSISDVGISLDCLRFTNITSEAHVSFSGEYVVPKNLLWNKADSDRTLILNLDVSAKFIGPDLAKLTSSKIQSFEYKLEAVQGGCYNTETVTHTTSMNIPYNATAKMFIKKGNILLQGKVLEQEAKKILPNFEIENDSIISFPVEGEVTAHMLGVGFDKVNHCGDDV
jgi:hypothetical protein